MMRAIKKMMRVMQRRRRRCFIEVVLDASVLDVLEDGFVLKDWLVLEDGFVVFEDGFGGVEGARMESWEGTVFTRC